MASVEAKARMLNDNYKEKKGHSQSVEIESCKLLMRALSEN